MVNERYFHSFLPVLSDSSDKQRRSPLDLASGLFRFLAVSHFAGLYARKPAIAWQPGAYMTGHVAR